MKSKIINLLLFLLAKLTNKEELLSRLIAENYPDKFPILFLYKDVETAKTILELKEQLESGELKLMNADDMGLPEEEDMNIEEFAFNPKKPIIQ